jgi:hypothetical protein
MSSVKVTITMSLDGFVAGPSQREKDPLGIGGEPLISVVPTFLGGGARLFDNLGQSKPRLRQVEAVEAPGVTHIRHGRDGNARPGQSDASDEGRS